MEELVKEVSLRREAEEQLQVLLESSPAAIVTINASGEICLANQAAQQLLAPNVSLKGQSISSYLPSLRTVLQTQPSRTFRTTLQCKGQRSTGEAFLAGVWFSTYQTVSGLRLAAVVVDLSEELRNREDLSLDHLLRTSRILVSAVAHEVRNLCGAAVVLQQNLSRVRGLTDNEDFQALTSLIQSLERMSALSLKTAPPDAAATVELPSVLDELRVLIEGTLGESSIQIEWQTPAHLPLVWADRYGLTQVFLNLVKNSQRAMESTDAKKLCISAMIEEKHVAIRFEDSGIGVTNPDNLFRPFRPGAETTGLGLYVSRSIMRSFGGDLLYEPRPQGCCFAVVVPAVVRVEETVNAQRSSTGSRYSRG
ncbi:MAG: ATP-binding protein [Terriglobales bacterium]